MKLFENEYIIKSLSELLNLLDKWKDSNKSTKKLIGFQFILPLKDYLVPFVKSDDFETVLVDLINDLKSDFRFTSNITYNNQWRHFGADVNGENGVDQISSLVESLKKHKSDRRLLLVAWNPQETGKCNLTHCLMQFYVSNGNLSCKLYQSSGDINRVMRYDSCKAVMLTYMLCHVSGLKPGMFIHSFGELELGTASLLHDIVADAEFPTVEVTEPCGEMSQFSTGHFRVVSSSSSNIENHPILLTTAITPRHDEYQYLDLVRAVIQQGVRLDDRTGVGTVSIFGPQMVFSLRGGILPLLTTKRVFCRGIIEELLWFLRGSTDGMELTSRNVHIWDANGSREFLDSVGLVNREPGDLGPVYGFQWRHFGATYVDRRTDYSDKGVDQIARLIESIKNDPSGRDHVVMAWNPKDLGLMALPPCHCLVQFFVDSDRNELSCKLYQRSGDLGLGVPFNIASYAILTYMVAHVTGLRPGLFIHTLGDAHVYVNHIDALKEQLAREPRQFPQLRFRRRLLKIEDFEYDDFLVENYDPHPKIAMDMAL